MFGLGVGEIAVILIIALVVIGPKKLPELARTLGKGFKEFQGAMRGLNQTIQNPDQNHHHPHPPQQQNHVPWEEQFKDDPPHDQNLMGEDLRIAQEEEAIKMAGTQQDMFEEPQGSSDDPSQDKSDK